MKNTVAAAILAISLSASTGCTTMSDFGANMTRTARMFRPRPFDEPGELEDAGELHELVDDGWGAMMKEGRPNDARERDPDRFWVENVMSPQARSIERNLGFE